MVFSIIFYYRYYRAPDKELFPHVGELVAVLLSVAATWHHGPLANRLRISRLKRRNRAIDTDSSGQARLSRGL